MNDGPGGRRKGAGLVREPAITSHQCFSGLGEGVGSRVQLRSLDFIPRIHPAVSSIVTTRASKATSRAEKPVWWPEERGNLRCSKALY